MKSKKEEKKNQTLKLIDAFFPEIDEREIETNEELFSESELIEDMIQYVNFQVGREYYAIEISNVLEIVKLQRISFLPAPNPYLLGLINLRGNIIPVFDTHKIFQVESLQNKDTMRIIIIQIEQSNIGFFVDQVSQVIEIKKDDIDLPMVTLEVEKTEYIVGETNFNGQLVAILDIGKLIRNEIFVTK